MLIVDLQKDATPTKKLQHGHVVVGTTAVQVSSIGTALLRGVVLRAPGAADPVANTVPVWIGKAHVTANSNTITGGLPLLPGSEVFISIDDLSKLYVISTAGSQDLAWMGM